jgi:predicted GTPase
MNGRFHRPNHRTFNQEEKMERRVVIMGAAGRDFHNFNVCFRDNESYRVVAFTATQIPNIAGRKYPAELAGKLYPSGIPIVPEEELIPLIRRESVDEVVFAYSDVSHEYVMHRAEMVTGAGADFILLGSRSMLKSKKPVIAVTAVRTGSGKSQTTRRVGEILQSRKLRTVAVRHPMPYGDLVRQSVQRFETYADLEAQNCTIEEREEYEPHIDMGHIVYAGVDYGAILETAEKEADVILWDGGNNDTPFYRPDLWICVADPHRPGHETSFHPGETNARMADVVVINKIDTADPENVRKVRESIKTLNPKAMIIEAASPIDVEHPELIRGKRVLVIEDGPTVTHGGMTYGAGVVAAKQFGAAEIVDPRPWISGIMAGTFAKYPGIGKLLPAMGYSGDEIANLQAVIDAVPCDAVVIGTPIDLTRIIKINKPAVRVRYRLEEIGSPNLEEALKGF